MSLAPYAARDERSRGRRHPEPKPAPRGEFQRDRDRVIHCAAFRRLEYKTQVFVNHEGDLFRTRLTHSIEVAQIARSIARALHLNEDLSEAIALAHDLGHTPFGHVGQDALNACLREDGGFEHNLQSLRVVEVLEERYAGFDGLNLTFETREGILKHCSLKKARELGELGERFIVKRQPSLEAQLVNLADEIAYNNHDVDDGLRSGLLTIEQLQAVELFSAHYGEVSAKHPDLAARRRVHETIRRMINLVVSDVIATAERALKDAAVKTVDDVRARPEPLMGYSAALRDKVLALKRFLREALYRHPHVRAVSERAHRTVEELYRAYLAAPRELPEQYRERLDQESNESTSPLARVAADYIAGMTDRYAIKEHSRLYGPGLWS